MSDKMESLLNQFPGFITGETTSSFEEILSNSNPPTAINNAFKAVGKAMKTTLYNYETQQKATKNAVLKTNCD